LHRSRSSVRVLTFLTACSCAAYAAADRIQQPAEKLSEPSQNSGGSSESWLDQMWDLPIFHWFAPLFDSAPEPAADPEQTAASEPLPDLSQPLIPCSVASLDPVQDPAAQQLEASVGSAGIVDLSGLTPGAARALGRFESIVQNAGGAVVLKSAYRPAAYQEHLANVWHKWMDELKENEEPACQDLRAEVGQEFARHRLIETQHPVPVSDHTRGLAFDATVDLPMHKLLGRRRVTLDGLAHLAGLRRPAIESDPVHFKFVGAAATIRVRRRSA
jgi:hypothetical protein